MKEKIVVYVYNILSIFLNLIIPFILLLFTPILIVSLFSSFPNVDSDLGIAILMIFFIAFLVFLILLWIYYIDFTFSLIPNFVKSYRKMPLDHKVKKYRFTIKRRVPKDMIRLLPSYLLDKKIFKSRNRGIKRKLKLVGEVRKYSIVYMIYDFKYKIEEVRGSVSGVIGTLAGNSTSTVRTKEIMSFEGDMFEITMPNINFNEHEYIYMNEDCYRLFKGSLIELEGRVRVVNGIKDGYIRYDKKDDKHINLIKKIAKMDFINKYNATVYLIFKENKIIVMTNYAHLGNKFFYSVEKVRVNIRKQKNLVEEFNKFLKELSELEN